MKIFSTRLLNASLQTVMSLENLRLYVWKPTGVNASCRIFQSQALGLLKALGLHSNSMLYSSAIKPAIPEVEGQFRTGITWKQAWLLIFNQTPKICGRKENLCGSFVHD